ncbi:Uncharacterized protein FKW44_003324, partial [Caligus rogercresseyi]
DFYGGFFYFGYEYTFKCSGTGSPIPDVEWLFKPCSAYDTCEESTEFEGLQNYNNRLRRSGKVICQSCNNLNCENKAIPFFVTDIKNGFDLHGPSKVIEGEPFELTCSASIYISQMWNGFKHEVAGEDRIISPLTDANLLITSKNTDLSFSKVLQFKNASLSDHGRYYCKAYSRDGRIRTSSDLPLNQYDGRANHCEGRPSGHEFTCPVSKGRPAPAIKWTLNGINVSSPRTQILKDGQLLRLNYVTEADEGLYVCSISNPVGTVRVNEILVLQSSLDKDFFYAHISIPVVVAVSVALLIVATLQEGPSMEGPPYSSHTRLTQFDLPVDDDGGQCNEVCRLTNSRDPTPSESDCRCSLVNGHYATTQRTLPYPGHRNVMPYYSNCSVCDYSLQTLPMNHMMMTLPRHHYDSQLRSPPLLLS